jgi:hypothetical protein
LGAIFVKFCLAKAGRNLLLMKVSLTTSPAMKKTIQLSGTIQNFFEEAKAILIDNHIVARVPARAHGAKIVFGFESKIVEKSGSSRRVNGRWKTISAAVNDTYIKSLVTFSSKKAVFSFNEKEFAQTLAAGYSFGSDEYGLFIKYDKTKFHPLIMDILKFATLGNFATIKTLIHAQTQRENEAKLKAESQKDLFKNLSGVFVLPSDSFFAGNCVSGTLAFIRNNKISKNFIEASHLVKIYKKANDSRILRSVEAAVLRHRESLVNGFSPIPSRIHI